MRKKVTIVGRGTAGCISAAHLSAKTRWDIDWVYDPEIPAVSVGEGTTVLFPRSLRESLNWQWTDLAEIDATPKTGIYKKGWGSVGDYTHPFPVGTTGLHFNAVSFQEKAFEELKQKDGINVIQDKVTDYENVDSDFVLVCTGSPKEQHSYDSHEEIPVNAAYVTQCFWDGPRFTDTLTIARPYGWVFGIPLKNRCSIGYLFNSSINSLDEVKQDVQEVFSTFNLEPSDTTNHLNFKNYSRKINFTNKVAYTGNASLFLEPLEATSLATALRNVYMATDIWSGYFSVEEANQSFTREIQDVKGMICLHYMAGSSFDTPFWQHAQSKAESYIKSLFEKEDDFSYHLMKGLKDKNYIHNMGTWPTWSYVYNTKKLGIKDKLEALQYG